MPQNYIETVYSEQVRPYTPYPPKLCRHLFERYELYSGQKLLDVGCGRGEFLKGFKDLGMEASGLDISESAKKYNPGIDIRVADVEKEKLPYPDGYFDVVFSKSNIEHLRDPERFMTQARRILKNGGKLIVLTPDWEEVYRTFYEDYTHRTPFTVTSLTDIMTMFEFKDIEVVKFRQLPLVWKFPALKVFCPILSFFYPWLKSQKAVRFSKEIMLLGYCRK